MQNMLHICCTKKGKNIYPKRSYHYFWNTGGCIEFKCLTVVCLISNGLLVFLHSRVFTREPSRHLSLFWRGASRCVLLLSMQSTQWATVNFYFQYTIHSKPLWTEPNTAVPIFPFGLSRSSVEWVERGFEISMWKRHLHSGFFSYFCPIFSSFCPLFAYWCLKLVSARISNCDQKQRRAAHCLGNCLLSYNDKNLSVFEE